MQHWIDEPGEVRQLEALPVSEIDAWVKTQRRHLQGTPVIRQYPGGASNLTYLLHYPEEDLILRRPPLGRLAKGAHDMKREADLIRALRPVYPYVPEIYAQGYVATVGECILMQRLVGLIARNDLPPDLQLSESQTRQLCLNVLDGLIALHQVDIHATGLNQLDRGEGFVQRQLHGWSTRYQQSRTTDVGDFASVILWLEQHRPAQDYCHCLIHNDYRFDNVVLDLENPLRIIGVLDWEMATVGDPLMDLGNALAYWVEAEDDAMFQFMRRQPTHLRGMLRRQEVWEYYANRTGASLQYADFYTLFGLFRLAVIVQQIYERYCKGQAANPQFAQFGQVTRYLEQRCQRLMDARG